MSLAYALDGDAGKENPSTALANTVCEVSRLSLQLWETKEYNIHKRKY